MVAAVVRLLAKQGLSKAAGLVISNPLVSGSIKAVKITKDIDNVVKLMNGNAIDKANAANLLKGKAKNYVKNKITPKPLKVISKDVKKVQDLTNLYNKDPEKFKEKLVAKGKNELSSLTGVDFENLTHEQKKLRKLKKETLWEYNHRQAEEYQKHAKETIANLEKLGISVSQNVVNYVNNPLQTRYSTKALEHYKEMTSNKRIYQYVYTNFEDVKQSNPKDTSLKIPNRVFGKDWSTQKRVKATMNEKFREQSIREDMIKDLSYASKKVSSDTSYFNISYIWSDINNQTSGELVKVLNEAVQKANKKIMNENKKLIAQGKPPKELMKIFKRSSFNNKKRVIEALKMLPKNKLDSIMESYLKNPKNRERFKDFVYSTGRATPEANMIYLKNADERGMQTLIEKLHNSNIIGLDDEEEVAKKLVKLFDTETWKTFRETQKWKYTVEGYDPYQNQEYVKIFENIKDFNVDKFASFLGTEKNVAAAVEAYKKQYKKKK